MAIAIMPMTRAIQMGGCDGMYKECLFIFRFAKDILFTLTRPSPIVRYYG